jgi:hypothetical protein
MIKVMIKNMDFKSEPDSDKPGPPQHSGDPQGPGSALKQP